MDTNVSAILPENETRVFDCLRKIQKMIES